jgi:hypothetical protein
VEAYLLRDFLRHAGIDAQIFNENAQSALGEIPADVVTPEIWLASDHPRVWEHARRLLKEFEGRQRMVWTDIFCRGCGEANPGNFEVCWNCGGNL